MKNMRNFKKILLTVVFLIVLALIGGALFSGSDSQGDKSSGQDTEVSAESAGSLTESAENSIDIGEGGAEALYEDGEFTFNAGEFRDRFMSTLPEGYMFAEAIEANPSQDGNMQLDILDATGGVTDIAVLLNVKEAELTCSQMALIIKESGYMEDTAAILEWYLSTFLDSFEPEERASIMEEYLDRVDSRAEEYRVYSSEVQTVMMNRVAENSGKYYYVMIAIQ